MKELPILFRAPMVRAIIENRKTQTRRIVKGQETTDPFDFSAALDIDRCQYGKPGDRLWVKETFYKHATEKGPMFTGFYRATDEERKIKWRPSIFMPRWASRITLEVESVRVERLNDISESDAIEEGITWDEWSHDYIGAYRKLWESINGPGSWDANPFVWVIAFRKL